MPLCLFDRLGVTPCGGGGGGWGGHGHVRCHLLPEYCGDVLDTRAVRQEGPEGSLGHGAMLGLVTQSQRVDEETQTMREDWWGARG